jgi:hypothetical protein
MTQQQSLTSLWSMGGSLSSLTQNLICSVLHTCRCFYFGGKNISHFCTQNIMAEWLTLQLHIQAVPDTKNSLETGYPDLGFLWFFLILPGRCWHNTLN